MEVDWLAIKTEYITTETSYRKLAAKYGVHYKVISERGKDENWVDLRSQHRDNTLTKTLDKISRNQSDKMARIDAVTDRLLDKLEKAVDELEIHLVTNTRKEKIIEYNNDRRPDKPTREVIQENEEICQVVGIVDKAGLRQIAAALKDLKEIKMIRSQLDEQEQRARIANLERQAAKEDSSKEAVRVVMDERLEDLCQ